MAHTLRRLLRTCPTTRYGTPMLRQSPFHARVAAANQTSLWSHWAGHLVVDKYQMSEKWEYVAIRNAVGVFDSSPLYKYRITGPDAERYLGGVLARDVRTLRPGPGAVHDLVRRARIRQRGRRGVPLQRRRLHAHRRRAQPRLLPGPDRLRPGRDRRGQRPVRLAGDPGPASARGPVAARAGGRASSATSTTRRPSSATSPSTISRTGFTGDLGYEVFCEAGDADEVWDTVFEAGTPHGLIPFGQIALLMARIEAGLLLDPRRLRRQPPGRERRAPLDPERARAAVDAEGHRRRHPPVHRPQGDPARAEPTARRAGR